MEGEMKKQLLNNVERPRGEIEVGPAIFARFATFGVNVISQAFIGHIGSTELAAYALVGTVLLRFANSIQVVHALMTLPFHSRNFMTNLQTMKSS
ncbi:Protein detoxification 23 [Vitis vinifera]|uniref:Protein detoxification 23 n=1 Tax=Vitis vinifera TaxID=29760 RepID=A0A438HZH5_VITVI|nr:Protein detoxification 23 [Vitis vinifera]